jgi:hypothetical protein
MLVDALRESAWTVQSRAETEVPAVTMLVIAHAEAVELLAGASVHLLMPAAAAARSAYEAAVTAAWLLVPNDPAARDGRWLSLMVDERRFWENMANEFKRRPGAVDAERLMLEERARVDAIIKAAEPQLRAAGLHSPGPVPSFIRQLEELGRRDQDYFMYRQISQLVHPQSKALSHVRSMANHGQPDPNVGYGYRTRPGDWALTVGLAAHALMTCTETLAARMNPPTKVSVEGLAAWHEITETVQQLAGLPPI